MTFIFLTDIVLCPQTEPPFACGVGCSLSQQFLPSALMSIEAGRAACSRKVFPDDDAEATVLNRGPDYKQGHRSSG